MAFLEVHLCHRQIITRNSHQAIYDERKQERQEYHPTADPEMLAVFAAAGIPCILLIPVGYMERGPRTKPGRKMAWYGLCVGVKVPRT